MSDEDYKKAFDFAVKDLVALINRREELQDEIYALDDRIEQVRQGVMALSSLVGMTPQEVKEKYKGLIEFPLDPRIGVTDAVRQALRMHGGLMTPSEIRDSVFKISPAVAAHKNPLASIHAILRRLIDSYEVIGTLDDDDRVTYGWVGSDEALENARHWFKDGDAFVKRYKAARKKRKS